MRSRRLYEDVVSQIIDMIASGELQPGGRLPPERELAPRIGVSRAVLRESFRVLEERGLVVSRHGSGRHVRMPDGKESPHLRLEDLERASIVDILEARELIEVEAIALACRRITAPEIPYLRAVATRDQAWSDNVSFHVAVASMTHNFMVQRIVQEQLETLGAVHQREHYISPESAPELIAEHIPIAEAVISGDAELARALMRLHFAHTREVVVKSVDGAHGDLA